MAEIPAKVQISFENVDFTYEPKEADRKVLKDINFDLKPGEWLGLRGKSGSGKSTIAHLIPGLYSSYKGNIKLNGKDIRDLPLNELRAHTSLVSQEYLSLLMTRFIIIF